MAEATVVELFGGGGGNRSMSQRTVASCSEAAVLSMAVVAAGG